MKEIAVEYFKSGKGNCAQAVAYAWKNKMSSSGNCIQSFASCGSGKAPEGICGALYAAHVLSENAKVKELFAEKTSGFILCRDIRMNRVMPCHECVAVSAEILETVSAGKNGENNASAK